MGKLSKKIIFALILILPAFALIGIGYNTENNTVIIIGLLIIVLENIVLTSDIVKYALKDMKCWREKYYNIWCANGIDTKDFESVKIPLSMERRIFIVIFLRQILIVAFVILCVLVFMWVGPIKMIHYDSMKGLVAGDFYRSYKARRAAGAGTLIFMFLSPFILPILAYCITNAIYILRTISDRKYLACRAIIKCIDSNGMHIIHDGKIYRNKNYTLIGVQKKQMRDIPVTSVFIPEEVLVLPNVLSDESD